jgi:hypothetical protein
VPILDVFRILGNPDEAFAMEPLDGPERALARYAGPEAAKAVVSDAVLLAFALARQRARSFSHRPLGSRQGSLDEYCLMALIGASRHPESELAFEASAALDVPSLDFVTALAADLLRQMDLARLSFEVPDLAEFRSVVGESPFFTDLLAGAGHLSGFRF